MNKWIIKNVTNPLWEFGAGRKRLRYLKEFEKSQYWSKEKLDKLQNKRLRKLILHAYKNVPYYHTLFNKLKLSPEDIQTVNDLQKLPVLTKQNVADNFEKLKAKNMKLYKPKYYSTGGTSGRPLHFYNTKKTFDYHMAAAYRAWRWSGFDFGERYAKIWGATMDLKDENTLKKKLHMFLTENRLLLQGYMFTDKSLEESASKIIKFKPDFIISYATPLIILVKYLKSKGISVKLKGVITTAEKLFSHHRKIIEEFFGCKVYDDYGGRESSIRATQCEKVSGYHISVENGIIETLKRGKNVIGEPGKVVITEFHNYAFPIIRYENGDVVTLSIDQCSCGRTLPMLKSIEGRISDIFITTDGKYIPGEFFMYAFLEFTGEYHQVIQKKKGEIILKIVKGNHFKENNLIEIKKIIKKWLGDKTKIKIEYVKNIPLTEQGKRRYLISKVPLEF